MVVVGRVGAPGPLDRNGWRATLVVERTLVGPHAPGEPLVIAWEELGSRRPPRFADGARVLVALEPLPPGSLWTKRFPLRDALAIAARGEGFLRDPDPVTLDGLEAWLRLPGEERGGPPGVEALARLAAGGEPRVASAALARLDGTPGLAEATGGAADAALAQLVTDGGRPLELRRAAIALAGRRSLEALVPTLEAIATAPSPLQGDALDALGQMRGGLAPTHVAELLHAADPSVRAAAVRRSGPAIDGGRLRSLLRNDPAGEVRAAAALTLAAREASGASDDLVRALRDDAPPVRQAAMQALAMLGPGGIPALQREIWEAAPADPSAKPATAVLTLGLLGPEGVAELERIAHEHPSLQVRRLAELALGRLPEDH
ncbi:MAG: HEAT repeat domain-containing protein [Deltaproteobacteria bacterium]|nr:HEAT repeat domain-containing protein [Deltaproteobacteria bacterium]